MTTAVTGSDRPNVLVDTRTGVMHVTINRPEKRNALSRQALNELREVFDSAATDESLQCVVLTGAGDKSFAAGGDLAEFALLRSRDDARDLFDGAAAALDAVRAFPAPVIAALNGTALGGGAELAMSCDYRVAAAHARIGFVQSTLAITSGFGGGADLFAALGSAAAMRALAKGDIWTAQAANNLGIVDDISQGDETLDEAVLRFIQPFLARPPHVTRAIKTMAIAHRALPPLARDAERESFIRTWTHKAHWDAADKVLTTQRTKSEQR